VTNTNPCTSAEAIRSHYNLSNEFYRLWLGPGMGYACGLWEPGDDLEVSQSRKIDFHLAQARAAGADRILDVGCGWGTLLKRAVERHGVRTAVGLTLSEAQADWIQAFDCPGVEVRVESWRDHEPREAYDAIVSTGAFEHFARPELPRSERVAAYRRFFELCHSWLKPGRWLSLQTCVCGNIRVEALSRFLIKEILPEIGLPTLAEIAEAAETLFEIVRLRNDRDHYPPTLRACFAGLKANRERAVELVGEECVQRYEKYIKFLIIGCHVGNINLMRIAMRRVDRPCGGYQRKSL
jgi:cyclopropane-fatty-acyl-phospholipid synthase